jgi:hypothetical protein
MKTPPRPLFARTKQGYIGIGLITTVEANGDGVKVQFLDGATAVLSRAEWLSIEGKLLTNELILRD